MGLPVSQLAIVLLALTSLVIAGQNGTALVCQTPQCLALSALISSNVNQSADPCDDFHAYACGNYPQNNPYDPESVEWSSDGEPLLMQRGWNTINNRVNKRLFEMLFPQRYAGGKDPEMSAIFRLASGLFRSCSGWVRQRNNLKARDAAAGDRDISQIFFNGVLSHLVDSIEWTDKHWFERALGKMLRLGVWPTLEAKPVNNFVTRAGNITAAKVKLNFRVEESSSMRNFTNFFNRLSIAQRFSFDQANTFFSIANDTNQNVTRNADDWKAYKIWYRGCRSLIYTSQYVELGELDKLAKCTFPAEVNSFSWSVLFDSILDGNINRKAQIYFGNSNEFKADYRAINLLNDLKKNALGGSQERKFGPHFSYLVADWLISFWPYFPATLQAEWVRSRLKTPYESVGSQFGDSLQPVPFVQGNEPFKDCLTLTKTMLGPVVERMYQSYYHEDTFDHVYEIVSLVQNATTENMRQQTWISPSSQIAIAEKIASIKKEIGFEAVPIPTFKVFYASTIHTMQRTNFTTSYKNFGTLYSIALCAIAGKWNNRISGDASGSVFKQKDSLEVNAFNFLGNNQIIVPMGILTPFLYHKSYPDYMNLGGIGVIIGHEIGHGFDETGHELNNRGATGHFWDNATEAGYLQRMQCVRDRFSAYEIVPGQLHRNSKATLGNDIADLMSVRSAFAAVKRLLRDQGRLVRLPNLPESLTPEKLFFIQAAQVWCSKFEPMAILKNYDAYYSVHSPAHVRLRGMMANNRDFETVFQCARDKAMNARDKCEFW